MQQQFSPITPPPRGERGPDTEVHWQTRVAQHRLALLGTLVAGVAHDASNLFLPLRMLLEHIENTELTPAAREDLKTVQLIVRQFQNSVVNLRWLSADTGRALAPTESLDLHAWAANVAAFHRNMLPRHIELVFDIPAGLPRARIREAALSQAVFNLISNARRALVSEERNGRIIVAARPISDGSVTLSVEDDGPGMPADVLAFCATGRYSTRPEGGGLGLCLVRELILSSGGTLAFVSPVPGEGRGTRVLMNFPAAIEVPPESV